MNVVILSRGAFPGFDGPARRVKYLGAGLAMNGCDVLLVVAYPPNPVPCDRQFEDTYGYRYLHTVQREQTESTPLLKKVYYKLVGTMQAYRVVAAQNAAKPVDAMLICGVGFVEMIVARCIARRFGIKLTVDKNDVNYRLKAKSSIGVYGFLSGINIWLSDFLLRRWADAIFTVNTRLHREYTGRTSIPVRSIIPSFIDRREIGSVRPVDELFDHYDEGLTLLSVVTTPAHLYGLVPFAKALAQLRDRFKFRLFVLGSRDSATEDCISQLLDAYGLRPITKVLTNISPEIIQSVYAGVDIILNGQQEPVIAEGGFPGKTAEILASGRPIVTTLFSDLGKYYVHGRNCLVVRYDDLDSYTTAITALFESPELRDQLGREGRRTALESFEYVAGTRALKEDLAALCAGVK